MVPDALLQRLKELLQNVTCELREFVEKQQAVMRQACLPRRHRKPYGAARGKVSAIGRSNPAPSFRTFAGAKLIVTALAG